MARIRASTLGIPLLRAVGIDPSTVRRVDLVVEAGGIAEMRVTHYVDSKDVPAIERVFEMTSWEERTTDDAASPLSGETGSGEGAEEARQAATAEKAEEVA